jgi:HAD superfamily hydrolase (TIGR01509 family)
VSAIRPAATTGRALLFDFNGVLVDDEELHFRALQEVLREQRIDLTREQYYAEYMGFDDRMCFLEAFRRMHRTPVAQQIESLIESKSRIYEGLARRELTFVPGAAEFVREAARAGFQLAVVSGALRREIEGALEVAGLRGHFRVIVAAEDVRSCKPDPEGYLAARGGLERGRMNGPLAPERCVAFEDSLPGMEAARAAGMHCVMLTTSHPPERLQAADLVWESFLDHDPSELLELIQR